MCGRYALAWTAEEIAEALGVTATLPFAPRYNIAPSSIVPVLVADPSRASPHGRLELMRWGLVPHWAKDESIGNRLANARAESVAEKPAFRDGWNRRRCLVPATAFYEWQRTRDGPSKQPFAIAAAGDSLLTLGGVWASWRMPEGAALHTFTILTIPASGALAAIHDRMPLIVAADARDRWLGDAAPRELLANAPIPELRAWRVSRAVNSPRLDTAECLAPIAEEGKS